MNIEIKKTICTVFMVPTLKIPKGALKDNGFINGFVRDELKDEEYTDCIFLLFKPKQIDEFKVFLDEEYQRTKDIIEDYDHESGFVVVVYKLNPKYFTDFELIRQGKYSKTSESFQKEFPKEITITRNGLSKNELSLQYRVFNKTEDLVKFWEDMFDVTFDPSQEIWHGWELEKETLTKDKLEYYESVIR